MLNVAPKELKAFEQEANLMKSLRPHANVVLVVAMFDCLTVQFQGMCISGNQTMIVTGTKSNEFSPPKEYLPGGDLWSFLKSPKPLNRALIFQFLKGTAAGMMHITEEGLVHKRLSSKV